MSAVERALSDIFLPTDTIPTPLTPLVVNTGRNLVLIDPGNGDFLPAVAGHAVKNMRAAAIRPEDVDTVLLTHFHVDHLCGLRLNDGAYQYPNARIYVPEGEWSYWMDDGAWSRAPQRQQVYFSNARRVFLPIADKVERFGPDKEIVPGIRSIGTPGHTPGHSSFLVSSEGKDLLVWGRYVEPYGHPAALSIVDAGVGHGPATRAQEQDAHAGHGDHGSLAGELLPRSLSSERLRQEAVGSRIPARPAAVD